MGERTEKPTARKRGDARRKGQVPKSQDLGAAVMLGVGVLIIAVGGGWIFDRLALAMRTLLDIEYFDMPLSPASMGPAFEMAMDHVFVLLIPVLVVAFLAAYLSQYFQVGWLITLEPIRPKFNKFNPVSGLKKIFGIRGQFKTLANTLKLIIMVGIAVFALRVRLPMISALPKLDAIHAMKLVAQMGLELAIILVILLLLIAIIDYVYQRWQHTKDLMMTKQEVKDERRSVEGDPQIKGKRMRMYQNIVMQQIAAAIPKADAVVTNPTHFSVAIQYDQETMKAPRVVAKGADHLAFHIRRIAQAHKVPIVERPPLARGLYWHVEVGDEIAPEHYEAVAELLAYVYRIDQRPDRTRPSGARTAQQPTRPATPQGEPVPA